MCQFFSKIGLRFFPSPPRANVLFGLFLALGIYNSLPAHESRPRICLNMIVKDEAEVIERCLKSVIPIIDTWIIVDTGSTDGTQAIIKEFMKKRGIDGSLYERKWINFEHNRNEALQLAKEKADYLLFMDADEFLIYEEKFQMPVLSKDYYYINVDCFKTEYKKIFMVNTDHEWRWQGVLHEVLTPKANMTFATLSNVQNIYTTEGCRSQNPLKFADDIKILEAELKKDPCNSRYVFYLAQSYCSNQDFEKALKTYKKRVSMGGWKEEVYYSLLQIACIQEKIGSPESEIVQGYFEAYLSRPSRIEAIFYLARHYNQRKEYEKAYQTTQLAKDLLPTEDILFTQPWMLEFGLPVERALSAYWTGRFQESRDLCLQMLGRRDISEDYKKAAKECYDFASRSLPSIFSQ